MWNFESHMEFAVRCEPWKVTSCESLVLQALQLKKVGICYEIQGG